MGYLRFQYRLEPRADQVNKIERISEGCRRLWNYFLSLREDMYLAARSAGGSIPKYAFGYVQMCKELTYLRKHCTWLKRTEVSSLQQTLKDLDKAYLNFFNGVKGYPKFRSKGAYRFRICGKKSFGVDQDWVRLPNVGWVRFNLSRPISGEIKNVSVSNKRGFWMVSFCIETTSSIKCVAHYKVGIDLGVSQSVSLSDGSIFSVLVPDDQDKRFYARLSRQVCRKMKGSNRYAKAAKRLSGRAFYHARKVLDSSHKITTHLTQAYSEIHVEDLNLREMTKSAKGTAENPGRNIKRRASLNRDILANAHGQTIRLLQYKCERSGAKLIFKNPAYTSQECAECHHITAENRPSQAVFKCVKCGHSDNADRNAARVVLMRPAVGQTAAARRGNVRRLETVAVPMKREPIREIDSEELTRRESQLLCLKR